MISLRYHVVSLAAVFLALALGVVFGSTAVSERLLSGLSADRAELRRQLNDLQVEGNALRARLAEADSFALAAGPRTVRDILRGRSVLVLATADADPADRAALSALLGQAGATLTGEVQLTDAFTDPDRAEQLSELSARLLPAGMRPPATSDAGTLAGGLLGALLLDPAGQPQITAAQTTAALAGLDDGGYLKVAGDLRPAQLAVVLTGAHPGGVGGVDRAGTVARFATQLDRSGAGAVLAGRSGSAEDTGPVGVVRSDAAATSLVSTVDDVGTAAGRVVTVLALAEQARGGAGHYGTAGNAQGPVPLIES